MQLGDRYVIFAQFDKNYVLILLQVKELVVLALLVQAL